MGVGGGGAARGRARARPARRTDRRAVRGATVTHAGGHAASEAGGPHPRARRRSAAPGAAVRPPAGAPGRPLDLETRSRLFGPTTCSSIRAAPRGTPAERSSARVVTRAAPARGRHDDVRVRRGHRRRWLVLGESYNRGWRAWCDGRDLGEPRVLDGYANGWLLRPRLPRRALRLRTAARGRRWLYIVSGLVCVGLLVFLVVAARRRGGRSRARTRAHPNRAPCRCRSGPPRWRSSPAPRCVGFMFALRAGVVAGPAAPAGLLARRLQRGCSCWARRRCWWSWCRSLYLLFPRRGPRRLQHRLRRSSTSARTGWPWRPSCCSRWRSCERWAPLGAAGLSRAIHACRARGRGRAARAAAAAPPSPPRCARTTAARPVGARVGRGPRS